MQPSSSFQTSPRSGADVQAAIGRMLDGRMEDSAISSFLLDLNRRGFGKEEMTGAAKALRERMILFEGAEDALDCCGTGGDMHGTLNISTAAAFVLAGGGVRVAKHGNRAVSAQSGSTDVLAALGVRTDVPPPVMQQALKETNICYLAAPLYHPAMKRVAGLRKQLGVRTIFNLLGPLASPANAKYQIIGVYDKNFLSVFPEILKELGSRRVYVVHGRDGLDEITTTGPTDIATLEEDGRTGGFTLDPATFDIPKGTLDALKGGDAPTNARRLRALLEGEKGPCRDIVMLNAAAGFIVAGKTKDFRQGLACAADSLDSGAALGALEKLAALSSKDT